MRRSCPLTFNVIRRSTLPAPDGCPCSVVERNRYADEEATAPAAITPLMKVRRETSADVFSVMACPISRTEFKAERTMEVAAYEARAVSARAAGRARASHGDRTPGR